MSFRIAFVAGLAGSLLASSAFAQEGVVARTGVADARFDLGVDLEVVPLGSVAMKVADSTLRIDAHLDTATAYGVGLHLDYDLTRHLSVGLSPRVIFGIGFKLNDGSSGSRDTFEEVDLRARATAHVELAEGLHAYTFLAPGYAIMTNASADVAFDHPQGLALAFGGGARYDLSRRTYLSAELGYQLSFQSVTTDITVDGQPGAAPHSAAYDTHFLSLGIGAGTRF